MTTGGNILRPPEPGQVVRVRGRPFVATDVNTHAAGTTSVRHLVTLASVDDTLLTEHPYVYCNGDPVNAVDPSGHGSWSIVLGTPGSIVGGFVGGLIGGPAGAVIGATVGGPARATSARTWRETRPIRCSSTQPLAVSLAERGGLRGLQGRSC